MCSSDLVAVFQGSADLKEGAELRRRICLLDSANCGDDAGHYAFGNLIAEGGIVHPWAAVFHPGESLQSSYSNSCTLIRGQLTEGDNLRML